MTHSTPNSHTAARVEKIRQMVTALQQGPMSRDEIGDMLELSAPGVRKYLADLKAIIERFYTAGRAMCRLVASPAKVTAYLADLDARSVARPVPPPYTPQWIAARDPRRHFHILSDDAHYPVRVSRAAPARDPMVAAFFGPAPVAMGAHA